jgi:mRNA interferase RelE/StbE
MNRINWTRKAVKQLRKINKSDQGIVYDATQALANMPAVDNVKP